MKSGGDPVPKLEEDMHLLTARHHALKLNFQRLVPCIVGSPGNT
jgi:hypothetical protein